MLIKSTLSCHEMLEAQGPNSGKTEDKADDKRFTPTLPRCHHAEVPSFNEM